MSRLQGRWLKESKEDKCPVDGKSVSEYQCEGCPDEKGPRYINGQGQLTIRCTSVTSTERKEVK